MSRLRGFFIAQVLPHGGNCLGFFVACRQTQKTKTAAPQGGHSLARD